MFARSYIDRTVEILIVEDNPADVRLLEEVFAEMNAKVNIHVAQDGEEGLKMLSEAACSSWCPDLILLDLNLPKVSGHDVLAGIKKNPLTCRIPVIVLTSSRAESDVRLAYDRSANAYVRKPSSFEGLILAAHHIKAFWIETATLSA